MDLHKIYRKIQTKTEDKFYFHKELILDETILTSSFVKNLEYNLAITSQEFNNYYFHLPILRSICEDIIFNNYLLNVIEEEDRVKFIVTYQVSDWIKSVKAQEAFFSQNRNIQPIITSDILNKYCLNELDFEKMHKELKQKYKWKNVEWNGKRKFPTIRQIAKDGKILNIYEYLYAATSRLVHFNPQTLLQMVWGEFDSEKKTAIKTMSISIAHYKKYYNRFCLFYGFYLLEIFVSKFKDKLNLEIDEEISQIREYFNKIRWPELITFEEMNIPLEQGQKLFHLEKNGIEGYLAEYFRLQNK